ncbi:hypothetical protein Z949_3254 [Sulfitobacter guttiformis KCTC 32187]|nr:hypothetical protein Z949_3254 [Sulfitobacter guttiformis KCTC 32187]
MLDPPLLPCAKRQWGRQRKIEAETALNLALFSKSGLSELKFCRASAPRDPEYPDQILDLGTRKCRIN